MGNYLKEELTRKLMKMVKESDGPELAYYYNIICRCTVSTEDAHYRHDEIADEIETMLAGFGEAELEGIMEFLGQIEEEEY